MNGDLCQRWNRRTASWRHTSEGGFDPSRYLVVAIDERPARDFVVTHHYSASWPAARLRYGMVDLATLDLVGVAVLGIPMSVKVLTGAFPTLTPYTQSLELSRLVLLDEVPANAESWFVTQAFGLAADRGILGVVAFSDPMPRMIGGTLTMPGHVGIIYQACNARYVGRGTPRTLTVLPDNTVLTARSIAKVTGGERGAWGVLDRLHALGAPIGAPLREQLAALGARRVRHPGNHKFCLKTGDRRQRRRTLFSLGSEQYPKIPDQYSQGELITV